VNTNFGHDKLNFFIIKLNSFIIPGIEENKRINRESYISQSKFNLSYIILYYIILYYDIFCYILLN